MLSLGMGSAVAGNSFPGSSVAKLSSLPPDGCQACAMPRALHYVQQDTATHGLWAQGEASWSWHRWVQQAFSCKNWSRNQFEWKR